MAAPSAVYRRGGASSKMHVVTFLFSDEKIEELRGLVEAEFGEPVTLEEARVMADDLLEFYELLCRIARKDRS
ncbi:hypothetical protein GGD81_001866 [Rhodobium orientis]|uniref:hypothetical protein n=1 Tax=Rhodobium orientis TaxID=34017 RepID=UPI0011B934AB|nr:hypothetical protein [Rhodobium orientis]MBB4302830.1 hypothetical protein [Rhodobium orientis]